MPVSLCFCILCRQQAAARLLAEKAQSAAETKEQRAELAAELEQLHASRLAAVAAKKQAVKQKEQHGAAKLQQYKATKQLTVNLIKTPACLFTPAWSLLHMVAWSGS